MWPSIAVLLLAHCSHRSAVQQWAQLRVQGGSVLLQSDYAGKLACSVATEDQHAVLKSFHDSAEPVAQPSLQLTARGLEVAGVRFDCQSEEVEQFCAELNKEQQQDQEQSQEAAEDEQEVEVLAEHRRLSNSKADGNIFYCDGDQFELFGDGEEDSLLVGVFAWCKMMIVEASFALHAVQWRGKRAQPPSTTEVAIVAVAITWQALMLATPIVRYALLFDNGIDYFCHSLGLFSYKPLWLILTFLMTSSQAAWLWREHPGYLSSFSFSIAVVGVVAIVLAACAAFPVLLLALLADAVLCILYTPMVFWLLLQLSPVAVVFGVLSGILGNIAWRKNWVVLEYKHDSRGDGTFAMKLIQVIILVVAFPAFIWCMYGYPAVNQAYEHTPTEIFMRVVRGDSVVLDDLKFSSALDLVKPHMLSVILSRLLMESSGLFSALPRKDPVPAIAEMANVGV